MAEFYSDDKNADDLISRMADEDQHRYRKYGHMRLEGAFLDRVFIIYQPQGLTVGKKHQEPKILTTVKVIDFGLDPREGCYCVVEDMMDGKQQTLTHVPKRFFGFHLYVSVPPRLTLRWDARDTGDGRVWRSMSFVLLIKSKNRSDFYSQGNTYMETPNTFKRLYPDVAGKKAFAF